MSNTKTKLITILNDQYNWIKDNPDFNLSGFIQTALNIYIDKSIPTKDILKKHLTIKE